MNLKIVQNILDRYKINIKLNENWIDPEEIQQIYSSIKSLRDPLTEEEHIRLFDELSSPKSAITIQDPLKIKLIRNRKKIPNFWELAAGIFDFTLIHRILENVDLSESEESALWKIFHRLYTYSSTRDCDIINNDLGGLYYIIDHKLKWLGKINVLDAGCGINGTGISTLTARYKGKIRGFGVGMDIEPSQFKVKLIKANLDRLPFPENTFEVIYSLEVIQYIKGNRIVIVMKELLRVLKPKGILVFSDPTRNKKKYKNNIIPLTNYRAKVLGNKRSILIIKY